MKKKIAILGAGSWGTALSILLTNNGNEVKMWSFLKDEVDMINNQREHVSKLPGIKIPESIICSNDLLKTLDNSDVILLVVPSQTIRKNSMEISKYIKKDTTIVCCSKGIEESHEVCWLTPEDFIRVPSGEFQKWAVKKSLLD